VSDEDERDDGEDPLPPITPPLYAGGVGAGNSPPIPPVVPQTEDDEERA
jgi:hypothetical protein